MTNIRDVDKIYRSMQIHNLPLGVDRMDGLNSGRLIEAQIREISLFKYCIACMLWRPLAMFQSSCNVLFISFKTVEHTLLQ